MNTHDVSTTRSTRPDEAAGVRTVELSSGPVEYRDNGSGPVVVLVHGLLMDASLWDEVANDLVADHRVIVPTLPLGAHRLPMGPDADLSLPGVARLVTELLEYLDLRDVALVGNDTGGAVVQLLMADGHPRIARAVLISCDAFDNFPPGLTGKVLALSGKLPPRMFGLFMQQLRLRPMRRSPVAFGWLTKRGDAATRSFLEPVLHNEGTRRDAVGAVRAVFADRRLLIGAANRLPDFDKPALVVWAKDDRVMPPDHGRRLSELLPLARLVEVEDSYTLVPLDQPAELARLIRGFVPKAA